MKQRLTKEDRAAEHRQCIRCGRPGETRNCHYNGFRQHSYGAGRGLKASRVVTAEFCQICDIYFSESNYGQYNQGSKSIERSEEFQHWCIMTMIRRLEE